MALIDPWPFRPDPRYVGRGGYGSLDDTPEPGDESPAGDDPDEQSEPKAPRKERKRPRRKPKRG